MSHSFRGCTFLWAMSLTSLPSPTMPLISASTAPWELTSERFFCAYFVPVLLPPSLSDGWVRAFGEFWGVLGGIGVFKGGLGVFWKGFWGGGEGGLWGFGMF